MDEKWTLERPDEVGVGRAVQERTSIDDETSDGDGGLEGLGDGALLDGNFHLGETREEDNIRMTSRIVKKDRQLLQEELEAVLDEIFGVDGRRGVLFVADGRVEFVLFAGRHLGVETCHDVARKSFRASVRWR